MIQFDYFVGLDQTGAINSRGQPLPLPMAILHRDSKAWKLHVSDRANRALTLKTLEPECLRERLSLPGRDLSKLALVIDSVFGLPEAAWPQKFNPSLNLYGLMKQASAFEFEGQAFGRKTAAAFFRGFLTEDLLKDSKWPQRRCEILARANSVFALHPFQRNIVCRTFRIWKDLGSSSEKWFQIQSFDEPEVHTQNGPWIFEGYPSLFWRDILKSPSRKTELLVKFLKSKNTKISVKPSDLNLLLKKPDLADAAILALGAFELQKNKKLWIKPQKPWVQKEGWILGLPEEA